MANLEKNQFEVTVVKREILVASSILYEQLSCAENVPHFTEKRIQQCNAYGEHSKLTITVNSQSTRKGFEYSKQATFYN